ncbi:uncharacterized protein EI97DRAFT_470471 [Westerdykella ornata]|uniref:Uncharacterized protein n=1 Tax=Westerdykella ornata TaxID=318751 RepID=A0A6A6J7K2_WESOR|nr:uncharacterized protein EI97DRAFT_470471 [Westerdykella ornata]KAF2272382.1 hypothetical protein EI97DRAFT_470471 [Westerdykella ornata]
MKFSIGAALSFALLSSSTLAAPAVSPVEASALDKREQPLCTGHAHVRDLDWHAAGGGYDRWFFQFAGFSCTEFGDTLNRFWMWDGPIANRQCYEKGDGQSWYYDITVLKGEAIYGPLLASISAVTGQPCTDMALPDWALGACQENVLHPRSSMCLCDAACKLRYRNA